MLPQPPGAPRPYLHPHHALMGAHVPGQQQSNDTELYSEVLKIQTKLFYIDLKENGRGKYLKIAEKGKYRPKSSIVIPISGLAQFMQLFDFYSSVEGPGTDTRDIVVEAKVFNFSTGENDRGRYLRVYESGGGFPAGGSSLMIPAGWNNANLRSFRESFAKVALFLNPEGISPEVDLASASLPLLGTGPDSILLDVMREGGPVLSVGTKHFFFELRSNERGQYLKIKEVSGNVKTLLVVPAPAVTKFQEAISLAMRGRPRPDHDHAAIIAPPPPPPPIGPR